MNIIGLSAQTEDASGAVIIEPSFETNIRNAEKRISRIKTLDGGCIVTDNGHVDCDRTFDISTLSSSESWTVLWHLYVDALWIIVATDEGCFKAAIQNIQDTDNKIKIRVLIKEKLNA